MPWEGLLACQRHGAAMTGTRGSAGFERGVGAMEAYLVWNRDNAGSSPVTPTKAGLV